MNWPVALLPTGEDSVGDDDLEDGLAHAGEVASHENHHDGGQRGCVIGVVPGGILRFVLNIIKLSIILHQVARPQLRSDFFVIDSSIFWFKDAIWYFMLRVSVSSSFSNTH